MNMNKKALLGVVLLATGLVHASAAVKAPAKPVTQAKTTAPSATKDINTTISIGDVVSSGHANIDLTVRYVNTMEAMQESEKGKKISVSLEQKRQSLSEEIKRQEQKLTQAMNDYKSKESTMNTSARNAEEAKITKMRNDLESTVKTSENDMKLAMQEATESISMDVEKAVVEIAQAQGFDIVTDVYTGRTIYASPKAMITDDLVKTMNKKEKSTTVKKVA